MTSERDVVARLRELADATRSFQASPDLESRLLQSFTDVVNDRPAVDTRVRWVPAWVFSVALALVTTALVMETRRMSTDHTERPTVATVPADLPDGFMPVPGAFALPRLESASIVRYEMPLTTLRAYGFEIVPEPNQASIDADLLIGQDGYARAIRVLQPTDSAR
jgi:hypothetical protein